jgi:hypothetical protein
MRYGVLPPLLCCPIVAKTPAWGYTGTMKKRFSVFFIVFIYECVRLALIAQIFSGLTYSSNLVISLAPLFSAPSILFPLMAFFFWLDGDRYAVFKNLYMAGKAASVLCAAAALCLLLLGEAAFLQDVINGIYLRESGENMPLLIFLRLLIAIPDTIIAIIVFAFRKR